MPTRIEFAAKQYDINLEALGTVDFDLSPSAWEGLCSSGSRPVFTAIENLLQYGANLRFLLYLYISKFSNNN
jgi:hypothetical protein